MATTTYFDHTFDDKELLRLSNDYMRAGSPIDIENFIRTWVKKNRVNLEETEDDGSLENVD